MAFLTLSLALGLFALPLYKFERSISGRITATGLSGPEFFFGFAITTAISLVTSPLYGIGFVIAVLLHETVTALACRHLGYDVARVRLVPLPWVAQPRCDHAHERDIDEVFEALYGPALAIVPMALSFSLFHVLSAPAPQLAEAFRAIAIMLGCFNFVVLLPFLPFAGGRAVRAVSASFWPQLAPAVTVFMTAAFATAALRDGSIAMGVLAAVGAQSLLHRKQPDQQRLSPNEALLIMACYAFTMTVHFLGGFGLLKGAI
ncbi:hypothetical protein [Celeribacter arenosi]